MVDEAAAIDDHTLHLYSLKPQPMWKLLSRALAFRQGRHDDPEAVEALAGTKFEVLTKRPMPVNTDGEVTTSTPARFSVLPAGWRSWHRRLLEEAPHSAVVRRLGAAGWVLGQQEIHGTAMLAPHGLLEPDRIDVDPAADPGPLGSGLLAE